MSQATAVRYATVGGSTGAGSAFANPTRVTADDASTSDSTVNATAGLASAVLGGEDFAVLSENGGVIPAGATIIRITATVELTHTVADSLVANAATRNWQLRRGAAGTVVNAQSATQNDNTGSGLILVSATTGGTQASPQTVFDRADLLHSGATNQLRVEVFHSLPTGALNAATLAVDYMRIVVEWILYSDRSGGGTSAPVAGTRKTVLLSRKGGGLELPAGGGPRQVQVDKRGGGLEFPVAGGKRNAAVNRRGGGVSSVLGGGRRTQEAIRRGGGITSSVPGGFRTALVSRRGGGTTSPVGGGPRTSLITRLGGGNSAPTGGGLRTTIIWRSGGGTTSPVGGGMRSAAVNRRGGGSSAPAGGGPRSVLVSRSGGGTANGSGGGIRASLVLRLGGGSITPVAGGVRSTEARRVGGGMTSPVPGGARTALITRLGGGSSSPTGSGVFRLYAFGLSGYTYNASGSSAITGVRVDVFRSDTRALLATTTSDALGYWSFALSSDPITYFVRGHIAGSPHLVDTSDEELVVEETLIAGPPV